MITWYNPFGDTFQLQIVDVYPFLSLDSPANWSTLGRLQVAVTKNLIGPGGNNILRWFTCWNVFYLAASAHGKEENKSWSNVNHENHGIKNIYVRIIWIIQFVIKMKFRIIYERKKGQITQ